ncbi:antizyme inhibitor 1-like [Sinocyclocheilus grahami]|uniref:antizyme inhibitor 1-like n=1 Tax=Sinocyclocheilus grahami TaxID=75366 RepID=UPI0007AD45F6|nr:PREDICTED: antizyme inhibitor 1-like [Sinocyclocheilus grahami]
MRMKGTLDEPRFSVELLEGSAALRGLIDKHIHDQTLALKSAFFVADLGVIVRQQVRWRAKMDQIRPFYTVKSNSSPVVVEILAALGTGFVCSNKHELDLVKGFGVPSQDIILGGTCKQLSHIKYAAKHNISLLVCDNEAELRKIARCHPKTKLVVHERGDAVWWSSEVSAEEPLFSSSLWGPSADDLDQVVKRCLLPELSVGDWLLFSNAGANGLGATFTNGEEHKPAVFYSITECDWQQVHNCGVTLDSRMKNLSVVPCGLQANISKASVSTPA